MKNEFMEEAIRLACQYYPSPNPRVGCVIVKNDKIIGKGCHIKAGTPHAEVNAVNSCKEDINGADVYVTLEPCSHYGKTPPCADMLCKTGVKNVYIGMKDPDEKVSGRGIQKLKNAKINVEVGICEEKCREMNKGYIKHRTESLPYIILKSAMTLDGKIATRTGDSKWITSPEALKYAHKIRQECDAIAIGGNTLRIDNPSLTARCESISYPTRIVFTSQKIDYSYNIFNKGKVIICSVGKKFEEKSIYNDCEITKLSLPNLKDFLTYFANIDIMTLLVEGGGTLVGSFLKEKLWDEVNFYYGSKIIGDKEAINGITNINESKLSDCVNINIFDIVKFNTDFMIKGKPLFN